MIITNHCDNHTNTDHPIKFKAGGDLLSHTLPGAVPSAQVSLATGFGKGPGGSLPLTTTDTTNGTKHTHPHYRGGVPCRSRHCITDASNPNKLGQHNIHSSNTLSVTSRTPPNGCHGCEPHKPTILCVLNIGKLVPVTSTPHSASRSGLSTPSSIGNLKRNLISKQASRLDAFSGYPFHT